MISQIDERIFPLFIIIIIIIIISLANNTTCQYCLLFKNRTNTAELLNVLVIMQIGSRNILCIIHSSVDELLYPLVYSDAKIIIGNQKFVAEKSNKFSRLNLHHFFHFFSFFLNLNI